MTDLTMMGLVVYTPVAAYLRKGASGELSTALAGLEFLLGEAYNDEPMYSPPELRRQIAAQALKLHIRAAKYPSGDPWAFRAAALATDVLAEVSAGNEAVRLN